MVPVSAVDFSIDAGQRLGFNEASLTADTIGEIAVVLREIGNEIEEFIYGNWPVLTGRSLRAWRVFADGTVLVVQNPVEYVSFINGGTYTAEGESAKAVRDAVAAAWSRGQGEISQILADATRQQELFRAPEGSLLGDTIRAAAQRQLMQAAGISALPGGSVFTSLRSAFTLQRIAQRERGRQRPRGRNR